MKEKMGKTLLSKLSALVLAVALCMGMITPAYADVVTGNEANPAEAAITKVLQMPTGTAIPATTFTFEFESLTVDGVAGTSTNMPAILDKTISYDGSEALFAEGVIDDGTTKTAIKQTLNILDGVTWPHAGVYEYSITETDASVTGMTYSPAKYKLIVYVANGTGDSLYVAAVGAELIIEDTPGQIIDSEGKVDPEPGPGGTEVIGDYSQMIFTNTYVKKGDGDPTVYANQVLNINKTVAGTYGDKTMYFDYTLTVTKTAFEPAGTTYKAFVVADVSGAPTVVTSTDNAASGSIKTDATWGDYIEVVSGAPITIKLKHGQALAFNDLTVGASYTAVETGKADYIATAVVVEDSGTPDSLDAVTPGTNLSTGLRVIGENANSAAFTNTYKLITPTGIIIDNLPFIMLALVAVGTLATYVLVKSRKRKALQNRENS